jgi:rod shape determining protein RodA
VKRFPISIFIAILGLTIISFSALFTIAGNFSFIIKELIYILIGFTIAYFITLFDFRIIKYFVLIIYGLSVASLILVLVVGVAIHESTRWINLFGITNIQPSEFAKIALIIILAYIFQEDTTNFKKFLYATLALAPMVVLIFVEPDMGTSLVLVFIYLIMMFMTVPIKYPVFTIAGILASIPILIKFLKPWQYQRFLSFLNPQKDPLGSGYNVIQSLIATGSGEVFGKGIAQSNMTKLKFVPVQYADFIFSAIGEIWGFIGSIAVLGFFTILFTYFIKVYNNTENKFGKNLAVGIFAMFVFQVLVNIGMCVGLMPVTGIPLPFVSFGGSSAIANFIAIGIVISINIYKDEMTIAS